MRIEGELVHVFRLSFVGELGFELHVPRSSCDKVYRALMECGKKYDMKLAGYRALYSLSCEKGIEMRDKLVLDSRQFLSFRLGDS